ncbi:uncharacterized protein EDB91DRAFT_1227372 [Suillus paluster]|uniref:uncharacterized protein n=1 Tax=Suillus paluster TaxID=48578 RepID=UPI001B8828A9|nr:uncharacterized protein EDB91DRAFT_1227372 [Suillus paluster]KAG1730984.1 hypothetical protein EDB91DRAFT_1227372 [Suillus paluster]
MSSYTPQTDLSLERSRLDGMVVGGVSYGVFFLLTVQTWIALVQRSRYGDKTVGHRRALILYIFITFVLRTVAFAANAKYTEMIWIDLRDAPGGPVALIVNEMDYRINVLAISWQEFLLIYLQTSVDALSRLLHRCFVIWNWARRVTIPMITLYIAMIALSICGLIQASNGAVLYKINVILVYLCFHVGLTVIYTILVVNRLLSMRSQMKRVVAEYDSSTYDTVVLMVIESALLYSVFAMIFIVAFALHWNDVSTVCFLSISSIQGIAQLFIILRVARGQAVTHEWSSRAAAPTTVVFAETISAHSNGEQINRPQQDLVQTYSTSAKAAGVDACIA